MDPELRREVIRRIGDRKRELEDARTLRAHVEAIAEVLDVEVGEVEAIVAELSVERAGGAGRGKGLGYAIGAGLVAAALLGAVAALLVDREEQQAAAPDARSAPVAGPTDPASAPDTRPYVQASILASILASIAPVRMLVIEYHMTEGEFPARLEDIRLERAEMRTGRYIDDLVLGEDGAILVKAADALAPGAYVVMAPRTTMGGLNVEWDCTTNVEIGLLAPCEHEPLDGVAAQF